jgi:hypothetical protein
MKNIFGEASQSMESPSWVLGRVHPHGGAGLFPGVQGAFPVPAQERQETFGERDYLGFMNFSATR